MELHKDRRPQITSYSDPVLFIRDMIQFRKKNEFGFSVHAVTSSLRKVSPTLVSLIISGKRKLTYDRAEEFAKLLGLSLQEKVYFKNWIQADAAPEERKPAIRSKHRRDVGIHLLKDWINVYVKDCFQIESVQRDPQLVYKYLSAYAQPKRIERALGFLLKEGYLRRTSDGRIVIENNLSVAETPTPSRKIRQFHRGALEIAKSALEIFPPTERLANTLVIPLDEKRHQELRDLIAEFSEKLKDFASESNHVEEKLYQLIINLSPTGGNTK